VPQTVPVHAAMPRKSPPGGTGGQVIFVRIFQTFVEVLLIRRGWHIHKNHRSAFSRATPAPSPPPTPACDESESDSDDSGAIARRTRSRTK